MKPDCLPPWEWLQRAQGPPEVVGDQPLVLGLPQERLSTELGGGALIPDVEF